MKGSHVHLNVKDLRGAVEWFEHVWQLTPSFQNERMASIGLGEMTVILDAAANDVAATIGFESQDCDADLSAVRSRGAVVLQEARDMPWGTRSAYVQGPGALKLEIEQMLPRQ